MSEDVINWCIFSVDSQGKIGLIDFCCTEHSFDPVEAREYAEDGELIDESMYSKIFKSVFINDFEASSEFEDISGGWFPDVSNHKCKELYCFESELN